ncbi:MAG: indoleamine 2,3-dioxygenase [Actinomycetota bacterium]|nr:indoleamine 2,3-dioxygenase [Actinomycetota bacterium]
MGPCASREQSGGGAPAIADRPRLSTSGPAALAGLLRASYERDLGEVGAFLPTTVPVDDFPAVFEPFLAACAELPGRYPEEHGGVRRWLDREFPSADDAVHRAVAKLGPGARDTLMTALSALGHTYRWDSVPPAPARFQERRIDLPPGIAGPWGELARALDRPRVGSAWSLHLCNWKFAGRPGGSAYRAEELTAANVGVARNWLPPPVDAHLERFSISFVLLEARGAAVLRHLVDAVGAAASRRSEDTLLSLELLHGAIDALVLSFSLNIRKRTVDPSVWLRLVQPTFAWSAETDVPGAVEGGPSGMQVAIIQALDAALGIAGDSTLARSAAAGRRSMPAAHRRFLRTLDLAGPVLRRFIVDTRCPGLIEQYNRCIRGVTSFRTTHHARGARYLRDRPENGAARVSTGLTIGADDDPRAVFDRTMSERTQETRDAALPPVGRIGA